MINLSKFATECFLSVEFDVPEPAEFYSFQAAIDEGSFVDGSDVAQVVVTHEELVADDYNVALKVTQGKT